MKTRIRPLLLAISVATCFLAACSDKSEAPAPPDPMPGAQMSNSFNFVTIAPGGGESYSTYGNLLPGGITGEARLTTQALTLRLEAISDIVSFEADRAKLGANWRGSYALRCRNRSSDPVFVSYSHRPSNGVFSSYRLSDTTQDLTGSLTITAYDARRQLLSGTYEVRAPEQLTPTGVSNNPKCTIMLTGEFHNLKVQP